MRPVELPRQINLELTRRPAETGTLKDESDRDQIVERLGWTSRQRLDYLLDMLAFEDRARRATRVA